MMADGFQQDSRRRIRDGFVSGSCDGSSQAAVFCDGRDRHRRVTSGAVSLDAVRGVYGADEEQRVEQLILKFWEGCTAVSGIPHPDESLNHATACDRREVLPVHLGGE